MAMLPHTVRAEENTYRLASLGQAKTSTSDFLVANTVIMLYQHGGTTGGSLNRLAWLQEPSASGGELRLTRLATSDNMPQMNSVVNSFLFTVADVATSNGTTTFSLKTDDGEWISKTVDSSSRIVTTSTESERAVFSIASSSSGTTDPFMLQDTDTKSYVNSSNGGNMLGVGSTTLAFTTGTGQWSQWQVYVPNVSTGGSTVSNTVFKGSDYASLLTSGTSDNSKQFYLYNVGTGKFVMAGGGWGIEAMLSLQDYGMPFTLYSHTLGTEHLVNAGITDDHDFGNISVNTIAAGVYTTEGANAMGCNVPGWSTSTENTTNVYNAILDGRPAGFYTVGTTRVYYSRSWSFERVEDASNTDTYTYYLKEMMSNSSQTDDGTFYLGTSFGTYPKTLGVDRTAFYQASDKSVIEGSGYNPEYYQWRLVSQDELEDMQTATTANSYGGLNANVSYLLTDPYFDRGQTSFGGSGVWTVESSAGTLAEGGNPRKDWTIDNSTSSLEKPESFTVLPSGTDYVAASEQGLYGTPWNEAVLRKLEPADWGTGTANDEYHMANAQNEMAALEGEGKAYQTVKFTTPGRYMLTAHAYAYGNTKGWLFVQHDGTTLQETPVSSGTPGAELWHKGSVDGVANHTTSAGTAKSDWVTCAKYLDQSTNLTVGVLFTVPEGTTDSNPYILKIGLRKEGAERNDYISYSAEETYNDITATWQFKHDATYVAIDNMQLHFLGAQSPFLFDEDVDDIAYMTSDLGDGFDNRTCYLRRNAKTNCWQPIILPVSLTTEQVRNAFGQDVRLGKLAGIGKAAPWNSPVSIDFTLVNLTAGATAIEAGAYYLIRATHEPGYVEWSETNDGVTRQVKGNLYVLGRQDYHPNDISSTWSDGKKSFSTEVDDTQWTGTGSAFTTGNLTANGTWGKLSSGNTAAPQAGAYYIFNGDMYHLANARTIKGFKWWITADSSSGAKDMTFRFVESGSPVSVITYIDGVSTDRHPQTSGSNAVYNLAGQRVADDASQLKQLPKGIYITGGRKIFNR